MTAGGSPTGSSRCRRLDLLAAATLAVGDAARMARNARRHLARAGDQATGKLARLVEELETTIQRTDQVIGQTHTRLAGQIPDGATRLVSLHDPTPSAPAASLRR